MADRRRYLKPAILVIALALALWRLLPLIERLEGTGLIPAPRASTVDALRAAGDSATRIPLFNPDGSSRDLVLYTPGDASLDADARRRTFEQTMHRPGEPNPDSVVRVRRDAP